MVACRNGQHSDGQHERFKTISVLDNYMDKLPFSSFVDTIELIPLETREDNLIGKITRIIFDDGKYYLRSTHGMQNAKYFSSMSQGSSFGKSAGKEPGREDILNLMILPLRMIAIS